MAQGYSLHVGLNSIDITNYKGKYPDLRNAENDTEFYYEIAILNNFNAVKLIGKDATSTNLLNNLKELSLKMIDGDLLFMSYSGHGSRVKDLNGDESDNFDEVLVLFDRLFIDDEFQICWSRFKPGVRIIFINDSCYNGTVSRLLLTHSLVADVIWPGHILRGIDVSETEIDFERNLPYYKGIKLGTDNISSRAECSIIHIGGCQDNQLADDGTIKDANGKFTLAVRKIYDSGKFQGSYKQLFENLKLEMPPWQSPSWDIEAGQLNEEFEKSIFLKF